MTYDIDRQQVYKRTLWIVAISQLFGGAGLAAGITVGALIARDLFELTSLTGVPAALFTLGSAFTAYTVGKLTQRIGRRTGLASGFFFGAVGAVGVIAGTALEWIPLFFFSLFVYGAGTATNLQARYAGTDLALPKQRGKAVSIALVSTTLGAVAGPNLVEPMGGVATTFGLPALTGPFILAAVAYLCAALTLFIGLRPDPFVVARQLAKEAEGKQTTIEEFTNKQGIYLAAAILIITHFVMVAIMTMTPIHMENQGSALSAVGLVISLHVAAMYLPSLLTGAAVDRIGRLPMAILSSLTLGVTGILTLTASGHSFWQMAVPLILLGIGWNLGLIAGTSLLIDSTSLEVRAKYQGKIDVFVAISGTLGSLTSGLIVGYTSYAQLGVVGMSLALLLLPLVGIYHFRKRKVVI
ncbi:MFS transporter [Chryseomicrobium palamuruense]|uniref:MFS transporter n=1 Tax=Chryseomicrobium palamuruense TaxID=682973 RepID=A0ABV8UW14_9BACL